MNLFFLYHLFPKEKRSRSILFLFIFPIYVEKLYIPVVDAHLAVVILEFWDPFSAYLSCTSMALPRCDKEFFSFVLFFFFWLFVI